MNYRSANRSNWPPRGSANIDGAQPCRKRRDSASAAHRRSRRSIARSGKTIERMILDPAAGQFANKRLVIVPDGALHYVAFAALRPQRAGERGARRRQIRNPQSAIRNPLIVDHEIVTLPSASVIATQRREMAGRPIAPKLLAVLADPVFHVEDERFGRTAKRPATATQDPQPRRAV